MISAEKFKTSFSKTLETLCDNLLPPSVLRSTHHEIFGVKLSRDKAANVRENAITCFKEAVEDEFKKMCNEMEIEEKLLERDTLIKEQSNRRPGSGWRPSGEANIDTYADRRNLRIHHIEDLKKLADELEQQLKVSKKALKKEHALLQKEISTPFASAPVESSLSLSSALKILMIESPETTESSTRSKDKKSRKPRAKSAASVKIPDLPSNFDQILEDMKFQRRSKNQANKKFGLLNIKGYDLYSLRNQKYVNDIVIDKYLQLVSERSKEIENYRMTFALDTYFYTKLNDSNNTKELISWIEVNLFEFELVVLPFCQHEHWLLFVADMANKNCFIYDSLNNGDYSDELEKIVKFLEAYAIARKQKVNWKKWSYKPTEEQLGPLQKNGVDCGVFICQFAEHLSRRAPLDFTQAGMRIYRKRMLYELLTGELLDDQAP